jgi:HEAT repeat protein
MTRQAPDWLDYEADHYALYPMLPLLPAGHPRWDICRFARGDSTANYRGYGARWAVMAGRLYLKGFGGYAEDGYGLGPPFRTEGARRAIGMIDVHEVDTPVLATWITCDLVCPSGEAAGTQWEDFIPQSFILFRVVRGTVIAQMLAPNEQRSRDADFRGQTSLLDEHPCGEGASDPEVAPAPGGDLGRALIEPGEHAAKRRLAAMLWRAGGADLDVLIPALASTDDPDVLRWIGYAFSRIGPVAACAIPGLIRVLASTSDVDVARAMAYALAGIGPAAASIFATTIPIIEARCDRKAEDQILHFVNQLEPAGQEMIEVLIPGMLASRYAGVQTRIAHVLGKAGLAAVLPLYTAFVAADDDRQRSVLARALGEIGPDAGLALTILLNGLQQARDDDVRAIIAEAVAKIGLSSSASLPVLRVAFRSTADSWALGRIADAAASLGSEAVYFLIEEFEAAGTQAKTAIARTLGELGPSAAQAVAPLAGAAMDSDDNDLIKTVTGTLIKIGAPADTLFTVRIAALQCDPYGYRTKDVLAEMQVAIDSGLRLPDRDVRDLVTLLVAIGESPNGRSLVKMLGSIGKAAAEPLLIALDQVRDRATRLVLLHALGQIGSPAASALDDAVAALAAAETDCERLQIVDDLARMGRPDERHMATLAQVLVRSSFLPVWWRLGLVLARFGAPAVPVLVGILDRATDDGQRRAMENALLDIAVYDASAGTALLAAVRAAAGPRTRQAIQAALNRSLQG